MLKYNSDQCSDDDNALCKFTWPKNLIPDHLLMHLKCLFLFPFISFSLFTLFSEKIMGLDFLVPLLPLIQLFIFMIFVLCQWPCML